MLYKYCFMIIQIFIAIIIGIILGTISGLIPGVHINLLAVIILSFSTALLNHFSPLTIITLIIAMAITHTFLDTIPATFLGAPEPSTALAILPAHRFLLKGRGYEAVYLTVIGSLSSLILTCALLPIFYILIKHLYPIIKNLIPYFLIAIIFPLILREKNKFYALIIFVLAGTLGIAVLNFPNINQPLLSLLSGLFGTSTLLISIKNKTKIPKQAITTPKINPNKGIKAVILAVFSGSLCSLLPGLGPAQAAIISQSLTKLRGSFFLIIIGGISTTNIALSFLTLYTINKARNGAVIAIQKIQPYMTQNQLILYIAVALLTGAIASFLALRISRIFSRIITKINYQKLCKAIIIFITLLILYFSGIIGILILITATALGILPHHYKTSKANLMACIILPVILYYLL